MKTITQGGGEISSTEKRMIYELLLSRLDSLPEGLEKISKMQVDLTNSDIREMYVLDPSASNARIVEDFDAFKYRELRIEVMFDDKLEITRIVSKYK